MHRERNPRRPARDIVEQALLSIALTHHPESRTLGELRDELGDPEPVVGAAVRALCDAGLLHDLDGRITATSAAVRFADLFEL